MDVNGIFHVNQLDNWQGSYSTGAGWMRRQKPKSEDQKEKPSETKEGEGLVKDEKGIIHVDVVA